MSRRVVYTFSREVKMLATERVECTLDEDVILPSGFDTWDAEEQAEYLLALPGVFDSWKIDTQDTLEADSWSKD